MMKAVVKYLRFILVAGLIIYAASVLIDQQNIMQQKSQEINRYNDYANKESQTHDELIKEKSLAMSDANIEKIAREKLGMVKPGEKIFFDTNRQ